MILTNKLVDDILDDLDECLLIDCASLDLHLLATNETIPFGNQTIWDKCCGEDLAQKPPGVACISVLAAAIILVLLLTFVLSRLVSCCIYLYYGKMDEERSPLLSDYSELGWDHSVETIQWERNIQRNEQARVSPPTNGDNGASNASSREGKNNPSHHQPHVNGNITLNSAWGVVTNANGRLLMSHNTHAPSEGSRRREMIQRAACSGASGVSEIGGSGRIQTEQIPWVSSMARCTKGAEGVSDNRPFNGIQSLNRPKKSVRFYEVDFESACSEIDEDDLVRQREEDEFLRHYWDSVARERNQQQQLHLQIKC